MAGQQYFSSTQPAVPSADGLLIAVLDRSQLLIRSSANATIVQKYELPSDFAKSCRFIRWSKPPGACATTEQQVKGGADRGINRGYRLLLADDNKILVYDAERPQLYAEISGATCWTKLADVDFGRTLNDIMVFSDFGLKLQIWSVMTKRAIEVKNPKSITTCHSYRPTTGHLAVLTRPAAHDVLMIMESCNYEVLATLELTTIDACGVKYSTDGNWLAVWDTPSAGCRVLLLTADGHLFKTYTLPQDELNLGVSCVEWSPKDDYLVVGDCEGRITVLGKNTFSPRLTFFHQPTIDDLCETVWAEEIGPSRTRSYAKAKRPATPPTMDTFSNVKEGSLGISFMRFNVDGSMLASGCSSTPSTLRIYVPSNGRQLAALIHHSPIGSVQWHMEITDLLLIQCAIPEPTVYVWKASWNFPKIFSATLKAPFGQLRASWLSSENGRIRYMLGNTEQYTTGQFTEDGEDDCGQASSESLNDLGPEDMFDEGNSLDLSPVKKDRGYAILDDTPALGLSTQLGYTSTVEDTFHFRRQSQAVT